MKKRELQVLHDAIDVINTLRNPQAWSTKDHKLIFNEIRRAISALRTINMNPIDLRKAAEAMSYGEPKLAYQYLFETSRPRNAMAGQLNRSIGPAVGKRGAFNDLKDLYLIESRKNE